MESLYPHLILLHLHLNLESSPSDLLLTKGMAEEEVAIFRKLL